MKQFFIAGTDTMVGKTYVSEHLLKALNRNNLQTIGFKPVASESVVTPDGLRNDDAQRLQKAASVELPYDQVNPITFAPPISPNIAAEQEQYALTVKKMLEYTQLILAAKADVKIIEGCGGWFVPLNPHETMADYVIALNIPVILVVAIKLGCLNHTILTYKAIQQTHLPFVGWIANCMQEDTLVIRENIKTLEQHLHQPPLCVLSQHGELSELASILMA